MWSWPCGGRTCGTSVLAFSTLAFHAFKGGYEEAAATFAAQPPHSRRCSTSTRSTSATH